MNKSNNISLLSGFNAMFRRDCLHCIKNPSQLLNPLIFFVMITAAFPLAVDSSKSQLTQIGPGIIWIIAILSYLLTLQHLYLDDADDGCLDYIILSPQPLPLLVLAKICAHWISSGLPLIIISPIIGIIYQMQVDTILVMIATLFFGTFALSLIGSIGASLTISVNNSNILVSLLVLPIMIPILIFGARTIGLYQAGTTTISGLYFMSAYCMFALSFSPFASAAALKIGSE